MKTIAKNLVCKTKFPLLALMLLAATGCSTQKAWVYHANSYPPPTTGTGEKVVVLPYEDGRENANKNMWGMYMVPVLPFGWQDLHAPEGASMHMTTGPWTNYKPTEDYAKAMAEDLRSTGLFADAFFDFKKAETGYVVKGKITNTTYQGRILSYGLSVYGPFLWFIGLPAATLQNELSLELSLLDAKSNRVLLTRQYEATPYKKVTWIYALANDFQYPDMLAEVNKQFCEDVRVAVAGGPAASDPLAAQNKP